MGNSLCSRVVNFLFGNAKLERSLNKRKLIEEIPEEDEKRIRMEEEEVSDDYDEDVDDQEIEDDDEENQDDDIETDDDTEGESGIDSDEPDVDADEDHHYDGEDNGIENLLDQEVESLVDDIINNHIMEKHEALHLAAARGHRRMVQLLLTRGGIDDVDVVDNFAGTTPLHIAAMEGHSEVIKLLLEHGANPRATTYEGVTPLLMALRENHRECVELLYAAEHRL